MSAEAKGLILVSGAILSFGLAVLYSASSIESMNNYGTSTFFFFRQVVGVVAGALLFAICAKVDAERWRNWSVYVIWASGITMLIVILPFIPESIAPTKLGSSRYLVFPGVGSVQPSELAKLGVILWTAMLAVKKGDAMRHLLKGMAPFLVVVGLLAVLAALEPDVSVALTLLLIMGVVLFASGARIGHFLFLGCAGVPVAFWWIAKHPYVLDRLDHFLQPGIGLEGVAPQLRQALIAVGSGGLFGQGYGQGMQQLGFVPLGYNDFIGSVIGEEWGFAGMLFIIIGFTLYGYLGFSIANHARSRFQQLVAIGITFTVLFTAFVHMGVVTGALPTTGLTLPFVSYGRSNLLLSLVMTGILVNIGSARERVYVEEGLERRVPVASTA